MSGQILTGKEVATKIKQEVKIELEKIKEKGINPKLVAIQVGENSSSQVYLNAQKKNCQTMGILHEVKNLEPDISESELINFIEEMNKDKSVTGIILQLPLPQGMDVRKIQSRISPEKDVEGVNPANLGWIVYGRPLLAPCTALAVKELIYSTGVDLYGKEVVMVGHSDIVGKPVALLLVDKFATVCICHIGTSDKGMLEQHVKRAEILIVAVGKAHLIKGEWIKEGSIVIDVGINKLNDKIVGDVEFETAKEHAGWITPVPGGVGPITTAVLLRNTIIAAKLTSCL
ncbi:MAG TPA: bifunctional 5,10-methylenetetrahydrofolate dehydrogenase/5,10-methenyltetrahydrofolate cyclohydrolase [Candidatus Ratteibacteria bacterium]|uniref:Bifunctional protein FolD n=1 Tax=candidate division TA06 bacterium ADurb.Bin131 TaxID=1852827 RepID=A0A1V6CDF6_UNCT6|nr:MAG: Bifunctional protein FolD protein [candidate division TA06 bacterium ADurb.Bin131]HOC02364.1 bifunctional 5,10-methylenetetrahydrofolate dehydrogenase/5,10-methenyltetrahydrofolate cyclohydrolase [bacterium]HRS05637.1 bifunctional 5,10-methylenetetrahydrofolate dehydrogenase/5,10-methenyltetrahydrofolate cyclohydrolase [Candidatus Ratteibacteria bacterium]HON05980.1 bifunctional 5,10-methylenetetrahydrofolate dehydrogenase/5,10-methenyltetrahydrofolate cyclohydrolase [bacterium]HPC30005